MTEILLDFTTQVQILRLLMVQHGYTQQAAIEAVDNELREVWSKMPAGHTTTFGRIASAVAALRTLRAEQNRKRS